MKNDQKSGEESIGKAVRQELADEARSWLRWAVAGAAIGAVILGGAGMYFFGWKGLGIGALAGAVVGGVGFWLFYLYATTFS